jgi:ribonucleoside-diphosphate reductase alpha chain
MALKEEPISKEEFTDSIRQMAKPVKLPEIMDAVRIKQRTPFGNMHVIITLDEEGDPREVFAQLGKGGDVSNSDLEGICRLISLYLRSGGTLANVIEQIDGIGSHLSVATAEGRIKSLPDGLAAALMKFTNPDSEELRGSRNGNGDNGQQLYGVKCPDCEGPLSFSEGCSNCNDCGYTQC